MKKNNTMKNGFTLVELIAVILILGIIITIATISFTSMRENVNEKQRLNLRATLKAAAQGYHEDTGVNIVPIGVLLQIGAIQADTTEYEDAELGIEKGDPVILDPVSGKAINCDAIVYDPDSGEAEYEVGAGCNTAAIEENSLNVKITYDGKTEYYTTNDGTNSNNWIKLVDVESGIIFTPVLSSTSTGLEYTWTNLYSPDKSQKEDSYKLPIPDSGYVESELRLETTYNGVLLYKDFSVKVDAKAPTITNAGVIDSNEWRTSKTVIATLTDLESGLSGYQLIKKGESCSETGWKDISGNKTKEVSEIVTKNGDYKLCVKDVAGHITVTSDDNVIKVIKIDNTAPKITVTVTDGDIYAKEREGTITITDLGEEGNIVGFNGREQTIVYDWSTNKDAACSSLKNTKKFTINNGELSGSTTVKIAGETGAGYLIACAVDVQDALGNTMSTTKSSKALMKLDNTGPECGTATGSSTTWTNSDRTIKQACSDPHSQCKKDSYNTKYTTTTKTASVVISDNLDNTTTCNYNVYVDKIAPTCGNAENATTTWTNSNRTIKQKCQDSDSGCKLTSYDTTYSVTTVSSSVVIYDIAGNSTTCNYNVYVDKEKPICGTSDGSSKTWTSSSRTIDQYCSDATSGCTSNPYSILYDSTTKTSSTTISDVAGNTETCSYNVYVDKTKPTSSISVSSDESEYNSTSVTVTVSGKDSQSGVEYYCYTKTNSSSKCTWSKSGTFENVSAGSSYDGSSVTFYGWTKDGVGNISNSSSQKYTIYKNCSETSDNGNSGWGNCSKKCGEKGSQSITYYKKDKYFGGACDSVPDSRDCTVTTTKDCGDWSYGSCECDGSTGTKTQKRTCKYYSDLDNSYCTEKTETGSSTSCNSECKSICSYDGSELFGNYSGEISGNNGSRFYVGTSWGSEWCYADDCRPNYPGEAHYAEDRICVTSSCGSYKGWTAIEINEAAGCKFARRWCQCGWG